MKPQNISNYALLLDLPVDGISNTHLKYIIVRYSLLQGETHGTKDQTLTPKVAVTEWLSQ